MTMMVIMIISYGDDDYGANGGDDDYDDDAEGEGEDDDDDDDDSDSFLVHSSLLLPLMSCSVA